MYSQGGSRKGRVEKKIGTLEGSYWFHRDYSPMATTSWRFGATFSENNYTLVKRIEGICKIFNDFITGILHSYVFFDNSNRNRTVI